MIPKYKCVDEEGKLLFEYIFMDEVPEEEEVEFEAYMRGSACPIVDEGTRTMYAHDYERWKRRL